MGRKKKRLDTYDEVEEPLKLMQTKPKTKSGERLIRKKLETYMSQ
jgi:hypothetical protein